MKTYSLIVVLCFSPAFCIEAQHITGRVIDSKTLEVLPFANVFLSYTTIGTVTDMNGEFNLAAMKAAGDYELVISFLGYETYKTKVVVGDGTLKMGAINLSPTVTQLSAVEVSSTRDKEWEKKLKQFKKVFFGENKFAVGCTIINPWVIDFPPDDLGRKFIAKANTPIEIDNRSLGYKVIVYLYEFWDDGNGYSLTGDAHFTELKSTDVMEIAKWEANRNIAYYHSIHCLFKSIIEHRIKGAGFNLYSEGEAFMEYDTTALVIPDAEKDFYKISLSGRVEVRYRKEKAFLRSYRDVFGPVSWISVKGNRVIVNKGGAPKNRADVDVSGAMSAARIAGLLPLDYQPKSLKEDH